MLKEVRGGEGCRRITGCAAVSLVIRWRGGQASERSKLATEGTVAHLSGKALGGRHGGGDLSPWAFHLNNPPRLVINNRQDLIDQSDRSVTSRQSGRTELSHLQVTCCITLEKHPAIQARDSG